MTISAKFWLSEVLTCDSRILWYTEVYSTWWLQGSQILWLHLKPNSSPSNHCARQLWGACVDMLGFVFPKCSVVGKHLHFGLTGPKDIVLGVLWSVLKSLCKLMCHQEQRICPGRGGQTCWWSVNHVQLITSTWPILLTPLNSYGSTKGVQGCRVLWKQFFTWLTSVGWGEKKKKTSQNPLKICFKVFISFNKASLRS